MVKTHTSTKRTANWTKLNAEDFKKLAEIRLSEAQALLDAEKFDGAFYLAGYAVECGLKACIAMRTKQGDFPPEPSVVNHNFYTHSLEILFDTALMAGAFQNIKRQDSQFRAQWRLVRDWNEKSRYELHDEKRASITMLSLSRNPPISRLETTSIFGRIKLGSLPSLPHFYYPNCNGNPPNLT